MQSGVAGNDLRDFQMVANRAARKVVRLQQGGVDVFALSEEDYAAKLTVIGWEASKRFRCEARVGNHEDEGLYCYAAIWNAATDFHSQRMRRMQCGAFVFPMDVSELEVIDHSADTEARYEAADGIARLRAIFNKQEWEILERLGECNGDTREAYSTEDGPLSTFFRRAQSLRKKARALLRHGEE